MRKNNGLRLLLESVFVVIFIVLFFLFGGTDREISVWISFGFVLLAYVMLLLTRFMITTDRQTVLGLSVYAVSTVYFIAELLLGLVFILMKLEKYKGPLAVQLVVFGLYLAVLISTIMANRNTANNMDRQREEVEYIKVAASRVKVLLGRLSDRKADKAVEHIYDIIHASPTRSNPSAYGLENEIMKLISSLEYAVDEGNVEDVYAVSQELEKTVSERNRISRNTN
jgi:signal transduction histidine kinase